MLQLRNLLILGIVFAILPTAMAATVIELHLRIGETVDVLQFRTALGIPDVMNNNPFEYKVEIIDGNITKYFSYIPVEFPRIEPLFVDEKFHEPAMLPTATIVLKLPYTGNTGEIVFLVNDTIKQRVSLSQLCNYNHLCEEHENFLSCDEDCPLTKTDNYCFPAEDTICDVDCAAEADTDCKEPTPLWKRLLAFVIITSLIILIILLIRRSIERTKHL